MKLTDEQIKELSGWDGGSIELDDGRIIRAKVVPDEIASISDSDCYGKVSWVDRWNSQAVRPDEFDGKACKMWTQHDQYWWQPPEDVPTESLQELKNLVSDLMSYGFSGVVVELCSGVDAYNRPIVVDVRSLWGIDSVGNGYMGEVVSDLVSELGEGNNEVQWMD